jgi:hypothetical protein
MEFGMGIWLGIGIVMQPESINAAAIDNNMIFNAP